jgi:phage gp29-like protein
MSKQPAKTTRAKPAAVRNAAPSNRPALHAMRRSTGLSVATFTQRAVSAAAAWRESYNPLRNLNMPRAVAMFEAAQRGMYADLQWTYGAPEAGIEATDPDLAVILERTVSGITECAWQIKTISDETRGFDRVLAEEQEAAHREYYEKCSNLKAAWEHLTLARFRGFSHLNAWHSPDGLLTRLEPLPQYAMVRQPGTNAWAWNPDMRQISYDSISAADRLDPSDYILMQSPRPVNRIGLISWTRRNTAEKDWDAFMEAYGLDSCFVLLPENLKADEREFWMDAAEDAASGGNGVLPSGADIKSPNSAVRGSQPFQPRLQYLREQLILVGTGGLLNGLAVSGSGTLAGSVHAQAFREIVRRQAALISEKLQAALDVPYLTSVFPGRPVLTYFQIEAGRERDVNGTVSNVSSLATAGYFVDPKQVEEETGYRITLFQPPSAALAANVADEFPLAPAAPAADRSAEAAVAADSVAATALNGAQITAMVDLLQQAAAKQIPLPSLLPILRAAFPSVAETLLQEISRPLLSFSAPQASPAAARRLAVYAMRRAGVMRTENPAASVAAAARPAAAAALGKDLAPLRDLITKALDVPDDQLMESLGKAGVGVPGTLPPAGDGELEKVLEGTMTASLLNAAAETAETAGLEKK